MGDVRLTTRKPARKLIADAAVYLLLLQTFAFIFSLNGRAVFSTGDQGATLSLAGEVCDAVAHDGDRAPAQHHHHHQQCALCGVGCRAPALDAVALIATVLVLALLQISDIPASLCCDGVETSLAGWASSWSSRAPPHFS